MDFWRDLPVRSPGAGFHVELNRAQLDFVWEVTLQRVFSGGTLAQYRHLQDNDLRSLLNTKATQERQSKVEIIEILQEFERRRLYLKLGFGSIMEFCIQELKLTEASAYRRISAMRLCRELPEIKSKITSGDLNLINVSKAQSLFRHEAKMNRPIDTDGKRGFLKSLENKSKREAEAIFAEKSDFVFTKEQVKPLKNKKFQLTLELNEETLAKLDKIKNLLSHSLPDGKYSDCIEKMCDIVITHLEKPPANRTKRKAQPPVKSNDNQTAGPTFQTKKAAANPSRYVKASVRRAVWARDERKCSYIYEQTGKRCCSEYLLEIDHITAVADGGTSEISNLRLVCRAHNQFYAYERFGEKHMSKFSKQPSAFT